MLIADEALKYWRYGISNKIFQNIAFKIFTNLLKGYITAASDDNNYIISTEKTSTEICKEVK